MKINKRKCRAFADSDLKMKAGDGILHASQIDYIIRTAVKIIDHHKTLVLYIYPRGQAAQGDCRPLWTVFQNKDDYITLEWQEDGNTKWRTLAFENLGDAWNLVKKCAFYSARDEARVASYFKRSPGSGLASLLEAQESIQAQRRRDHQRSREGKIIQRMSSVPALPRGLKNWIHRSIMPAYFFYDYKRGGKDVPGVCSACGHEIHLSGVKQGRRAACPRCKHTLIMKPRSRRGYCMMDRSTCQVIQNVGNGELVVRIIKVQYTYKSDIPEIQVYENARQFIQLDADGNIHSENYYYSYQSGLRTDWKKGQRPVFSQWQYNYEADTCAYLYTKNLPLELKDTPWQYCPITDFYTHFREPMQALPFLRAYLEHPRLEHLVKTGFYNLAVDLAYGHGFLNRDHLDESQDRTHQILRVAAEDVSFLRGLDVNVSTLKAFQGYAGIKDRQRLLAWQMEHEVKRDILPILGHMTVHKFIRYMDSQYSFLCSRRTPQGTLRYKEMQDLVSEYRDYFEICKKLDYDLKNNSVLYPRDLQKSHDREGRRLKHKNDARTKRDFIAVYEHINGKLDFEQDGMKIIYPNTPDDVIAEGHALHHCVGSYTARVANHECIILFLRKCDAADQPYYTIEVRGNQAVQVRGMGNSVMTSEVEAFIAAWEERVLRTQLPAA